MNKAINSKKIMALVAVVALVAILGVCLVACNASSVSKSLDKKGYTVITLDENASDFTAKTLYNALKNNSDFEEGLVAAKGTDSVIVIWFKSSDAAKDFENSTLLKAVPKVERSGKIVYAGTEQGVKDAK